MSVLVYSLGKKATKSISNLIFFFGFLYSIYFDHCCVSASCFPGSAYGNSLTAEQAGNRRETVQFVTYFDSLWTHNPRLEIENRECEKAINIQSQNLDNC